MKEREAVLEEMDGSNWWDDLPRKPSIDAIVLRRNANGCWEYQPPAVAPTRAPLPKHGLVDAKES